MFFEAINLVIHAFLGGEVVSFGHRAFFYDNQMPSSDLGKTGLIFVTAAAAPSYPLSSDKKISSSPFASPLQYLSLVTDQPPQLFEKGSGRN